jgi:hypothetical protein
MGRGKRSGRANATQWRPPPPPDGRGTLDTEELSLLDAIRRAEGRLRRPLAAHEVPRPTGVDGPTYMSALRRLRQRRLIEFVTVTRASGMRHSGFTITADGAASLEAGQIVRLHLAAPGARTRANAALT